MESAASHIDSEVISESELEDFCKVVAFLNDTVYDTKNSDSETIGKSIRSDIARVLRLGYLALVRDNASHELTVAIEQFEKAGDFPALAKVCYALISAQRKEFQSEDGYGTGRFLRLRITEHKVLALLEKFPIIQFDENSSSKECTDEWHENISFNRKCSQLKFSGKQKELETLINKRTLATKSKRHA